MSLFRSDFLESVGEFNPYNGVTNEICRVFIARRLQASRAKPDDTEEFELIRCSPEEVDAMIREQTVWDGMTLAAWTLTRGNVMIN